MPTHFGNWRGRSSIPSNVTPTPVGIFGWCIEVAPWFFMELKTKSGLKVLRYFDIRNLEIWAGLFSMAEFKINYELIFFVLIVRLEIERQSAERIHSNFCENQKQWSMWKIGFWILIIFSQRPLGYRFRFFQKMDGELDRNVNRNFFFEWIIFKK